MAGADTSESPFDVIAETVGERTINAFEVLGNETRLAILLALWENKDPLPPSADPSEPSLSFSELRDRVNMDDSGQFNYHLNKLLGIFVEQADEGYTLTPAAERLLSAVLSGALTDPPSFEGETIDAQCYRCGSPVVVDYLDTTFIRRCTGCEGVWESADWPPGTLVSGYRPPAALKNRTVKEWNRHCNVRDRHRRASMMEGVCPDCSGTVSTTINVCDAHDTTNGTVCEHCGSLWEVQTLFVCDICKFAWITPAWGPIFTETAVLAFFYEHGLDPNALFDISFYSTENRELFNAIEGVDLSEAEPQELTVTVTLDGDRLIATLNDQGHVIEVMEEDR